MLQSDASRTLVRYVIGVGPFSFGFHVNNYPDDSRRRLVWHLAEDRPNDLFRTSWGYWQLDPDPHGVVVTYAMAALPLNLLIRAECRHHPAFQTVCQIGLIDHPEGCDHLLLCSIHKSESFRSLLVASRLCDPTG